MDLIELFWRFGPLSKVGSTFNALVCSAGLVSVMVSDRPPDVVPLVGMDLVFIVIAVAAWSGLIPRWKPAWELEAERELEREANSETDDPRSAV
jgi:hypothetical protein